MVRKARKRLSLKGNANAIVLVAISIVLFIGFRPLFEVTPDGVAREILVAGLGALFVTLVTLILLDRQSETQKELIDQQTKLSFDMQKGLHEDQRQYQEEQKKNEHLHRKKVDAYFEAIEKLRLVIKDRKLSPNQQDELPFLLYNLQLVGNRKTLASLIVVTNILVGSEDSPKSRTGEEDEIFLDDRRISDLQKQMFKFCEDCREDLGLESTADLEGSVITVFEKSTKTGRAREPLPNGFNDYASRLTEGKKEKLWELIRAIEDQAGVVAKYTKSLVSFGALKPNGARKVVAYLSAQVGAVSVSIGSHSDKEFVEKIAGDALEEGTFKVGQWNDGSSIELKIPWEDWPDGPSLQGVGYVAAKLKESRNLG
jgi:hypothetical protein